jgi:hypothetical protein
MSERSDRTTPARTSASEPFGIGFEGAAPVEHAA